MDPIEQFFFYLQQWPHQLLFQGWCSNQSNLRSHCWLEKSSPRQAGTHWCDFSFCIKMPTSLKVGMLIFIFSRTGFIQFLILFSPNIVLLSNIGSCQFRSNLPWIWPWSWLSQKVTFYGLTGVCRTSNGHSFIQGGCRFFFASIWLQATL